MSRRYSIVTLSDIEPMSCPCGRTRRAFTGVSDSPASVHLVNIETDARLHYHKRQTEIYVMLEGAGDIELDGQRMSIKPMTAVLVRPGCRHRAVGKMKILNIVIPPFDPEDERFD